MGVRVLHLVEGETFAGIETHVAALAATFPAHGIELSVAAFHKGRLAGRLSELGVPFRLVQRRFKFDPAPITTLASILRQGIDLLHTHGYLADIYGSRAARLAGIPHVATVHGHPEPFKGLLGAKMALYMTMDGIALHRADRVIAVSDYLRLSLETRGIPWDRLRVIDNGLPPSTASEQDIRLVREQALGGGTGPLIGFVGRFDPVKAPIRFMNAAQIILKEKRDARFLLAGDGPQFATARAVADASPFRNQFAFLGFRPDVDAVIGACDLIILPSDSEGVPQVLLAAMRDGVIPVATRVGGVPGVLEGFEECLAAPDALDLAVKTLRILFNAESAEKLREKLRRRFHFSYTSDHMARAVAAVYRELVRA